MCVENIRDYQLRIDEHIRSLGGYWRSISALARLNEEVGELAEILLEPELDMEELAMELADIFVISTCISNQYLNRLDEEYKQVGLPRAINELSILNSEEKSAEDMFLNIVIASGKVSRIINHYEGDKKKKKTETVMTLGCEISKLHRELFIISKYHNINLFKNIDKVLEKSAHRDKNRFDIAHDPITEPSLKNFQGIVFNTKCSFARTAKVWGNYEWDEMLSFERNIQNSLPSLIRFTKAADAEGLDGYVFEIKNSNLEDSFDGLCSVLKNTMDNLSAFDPTGENVMQTQIDHSDWQFTFNGVRLFTTTFASFYPKNHPRYSPIEGSYFIFLQPEFSFDHHGIHKGNEKRDNIKDSIRDKFIKTGGYYDIDLIKQPIEAYKYIKPLEVGSEPIAWW